MGWAADDLYEAAMAEEAKRETLRSACKCDGWHWFQNDDGLYECRQCGEVVDL